MCKPQKQNPSENTQLIEEEEEEEKEGENDGEQVREAMDYIDGSTIALIQLVIYKALCNACSFFKRAWHNFMSK